MSTVDFHTIHIAGQEVLDIDYIRREVTEPLRQSLPHHLILGIEEINIPNPIEGISHPAYLTLLDLSLLSDSTKYTVATSGYEVIKGIKIADTTDVRPAVVKYSPDTMEYILDGLKAKSNPIGIEQFQYEIVKVEGTAQDATKKFLLYTNTQGEFVIDSLIYHPELMTSQQNTSISANVV